VASGLENRLTTKTQLGLVSNACPHLDMRCWQRQGLKLEVEAQGARPVRGPQARKGPGGRAIVNLDDCCLLPLGRDSQARVSANPHLSRKSLLGPALTVGPHERNLACQCTTKPRSGAAPAGQWCRWQVGA
jgi:hypothetical protein